MKDKISIIVPVYNCVPYLSKCVDSILQQTFQNIELLLVDDGSTDSSGAICDEYAAKDSRVRVIHQANAGVSAARNAGLDAATGTYVGFVDADDWIDPTMFGILLQQAEITGADIVMCDAVTVWDGGRQDADTIDLLPESRLLRKADISPDILRLIAGSACRCLYRSTVLQRDQIRFPVGIRLSEDRLFNLQAMGTAKEIAYLKKGLYFRYMRSGSATMSYQPDLFENNLRAFDLTKAIISRYWTADYLPVYARTFVIQGALLSIYQICSKHFQDNRFAAIKGIVNHPAVVFAIDSVPLASMREIFIKKKLLISLYLTGLLYNLKHGG